MSSKGYTEGVNEWGERQFTCDKCPTVYWFKGDMEDHMARHGRWAESPELAEAVADEAAKWQELGSRFEAAAEQIRQMGTQVDAMLARMERQHPDQLERARREGYAEGANAVRARIVADDTTSRQEARYDTLREILNALAKEPSSGYARTVLTDMLKGN